MYIKHKGDYDRMCKTAERYWVIADSNVVARHGRMGYLYDQTRQWGAGAGKAGQRVYALNMMMLHVSQWNSCCKEPSRDPDALQSYLDDFYQTSVLCWP